MQNILITTRVLYIETICDLALTTLEQAYRHQLDQGTVHQNCVHLNGSLLSVTAGAARLDGLQPSLKNVRQKIPPNGQTRLKFGF